MPGSVLPQRTPSALKSSWLAPWLKSPSSGQLAGRTTPQQHLYSARPCPSFLTLPDATCFFPPQPSLKWKRNQERLHGCDQTWNSRATWKNSVASLGLPFRGSERTRVVFALPSGPRPSDSLCWNDLACHLCRWQHRWLLAPAVFKSQLTVLSLW